MRTRRLIVCFAVVCVVVGFAGMGKVASLDAAAPDLLQSPGFMITSSVLGSGGGQMLSAHFQMVGTLGQALSGTAQSTRYRLTAGYWRLPDHSLFLPLLRR